MKHIFALVIAVLGTASLAQAQDLSIFSDGICPEGHEAIWDVSGMHSICYQADLSTDTTTDERADLTKEPRFSGCPEDYIMTTRDGVFEGCRAKGEQPEPETVELPEPPSICGPGEVVYYRLRGPQCAPRFEDAGAPCATAFDCDGTCVGDTEGQGICSAGPLSFGCTPFLSGDGRVMSICIE